MKDLTYKNDGVKVQLCQKVNKYLLGAGCDSPPAV